MRRLTFILAATMIAAAPVFSAPEPTTISPESPFRLLHHARQTPHTTGVPHLDQDGRVRMVYDPRRSFLPLGLYHGLNYLDSLDPDHGALPAPFDAFRRAGFTYVHTNKALSQAYLDRLHQNGLRMVKSEARPEDAERWGRHPAMLGWDVFDEPDSDGNFAAYPGRFEAFERYRAGIRTPDPMRPIFVNTVAWIHAGHANRPWWVKWHQAGDVSCHDNYPIVHTQTPTRSLLDPEWGQGIPETTSLAVEATGGTKPIWVILQAYGQPDGRWRYPSPIEARCMAYTALVHGATGLCWFTLDVNDARINATGWGISPTPLATYNTQQKGVVATTDDLRRIQELWHEVARVNHEVRQLLPCLYAPTSPARYRVLVRGQALSDTPVRALLKSADGRRVLIAVNVDNMPLDLRVEFPPSMKVGGVRRLCDKAGRLPVSHSRFTDRIGPLGVRIYELLAASPQVGKHALDPTEGWASRPGRSASV